MKNLNNKIYFKNRLYNIDRIIARKIIKGKKFYLIKWEGYPLEHCSWEPISHLKNVLNMVKEFEYNYPNSIIRNEYKTFLRLYKKYKAQKMLNKKRFLKNNENKTFLSNKFIINMDDLYDIKIKDIMSEEEYIEEPVLINMNEIKNDINEEKEKEKEIEKNNDVSNNPTNYCDNIYNKNELIKPVLIW